MFEVSVAFVLKHCHDPTMRKNEEIGLPFFIHKLIPNLFINKNRKNKNNANIICSQLPESTSFGEHSVLLVSPVTRLSSLFCAMIVGPCCHFSCISCSSHLIALTTNIVLVGTGTINSRRTWYFQGVCYNLVWFVCYHTKYSWHWWPIRLVLVPD